MIKNKKIPSGWCSLKLEDIAIWGSGGTPSRKKPEYFTGSIPWIKTGELGNKYVYDSEEKITISAIENSSAKVFPKESVGIAMYGATIGKLSIWGIDASTNQACAVAQCYKSGVDNQFLYYYLMSEKRSLIKEGKGGAQPNISQTILKAWPFYLPPLNEQRLIVEKIEELFSELDKGIESLNKAKKQLAVYRQALLKQAFEGKLTEKWRANNPDKLDSSEELVFKIKQEREERHQHKLVEWKSDVEAWEQSDKEGKKPTRPSKPKKIEFVSDSKKYTSLSPWNWHYLSTFSEVTGGLTKNSKRSTFETHLPYLRVANVYANELRLEEVKYIGVLEQEIKRVLLQTGDLLIVEGNGSMEQIGRVAIWDGSIKPCVHQNHLIKARCYPSLIPKFALSFLMSPIGRELIVDEASSTSGLHTLSLSKVGNIYLPIPSQEEQRAILDILDTKFTYIENTIETIDINLQKSELLRQSILKKAFSGQLVPQDPEDEPASELLKKIAIEKEEIAEKEKADKAASSKKKAAAKKTVKS